MAKAHRDAVVDALRGFAIISVMGVHGLIPFVHDLPGSAMHNFWANGFYGVSIFFVISGYLITSGLVKQRDFGVQDLARFYVNRFARIVPPLVALVLICFILFSIRLDGFTPEKDSLFYDAVASIFTLRYNVFYFTGNVPGLRSFAPLWSLTVEEQFYLVYPLAIACIRNARAIVLGLVCVVCYGIFSRSDLFNAFQWYGAADLLAVGCLLAYVTRTAKPLGDAACNGLLVSGLIVIVAVYCAAPAAEAMRFGPTLVGLGAGAVIASSALRGTHAVPSVLKPLGVIGALSYEIYLSHIAMRMVVTRLASVWVHTGQQMDPWVRDLLQALALVATFIVAYCSHTLLFEPLNGAIRRWFASASTRGAALGQVP